MAKKMSKKRAKQANAGHFGEERGYFSDIMKSSGVFFKLVLRKS